jgi:nucleotide-binding universal stress UspA family protein
MLPFQKILCPTDFSESSNEAIREASELASQFGSELLLVHVVSPLWSAAGAAEAVPPNIMLEEQQLEDEAKTLLQDWINRLQSQGLRVRSILLRGNAADEILRTAEEEKVDLLIIAIRGKTGLSRILFGSVAEKVVRHANCRVLTIAPKIAAEAHPAASPDKPEEGRSPGEIPEERKVLQEKLEAQWNEGRTQMEELKTLGERIRTEWIDYERRLEKLRAQQEAVRHKIQELRKSSEETWKDLRADAEKKLEDLRKTIDQTIAKFHERRAGAAEEFSKKREKYVAKAEAQLRDWSIKIDQLKAKAEESRGAVKAKYDQQIEELRKKQEAVRSKIRAYRTSGGEAWKDLKTGVDQALDELKKSIKQAVSRFKEKKEP